VIWARRNKDIPIAPGIQADLACCSGATFVIRNLTRATPVDSVKAIRRAEMDSNQIKGERLKFVGKAQGEMGAVD